MDHTADSLAITSIIVLAIFLYTIIGTATYGLIVRFNPELHDNPFPVLGLFWPVVWVVGVVMLPVLGVFYLCCKIYTLCAGE